MAKNVSIPQHVVEHGDVTTAINLNTLKGTKDSFKDFFPHLEGDDLNSAVNELWDVYKKRSEPGSIEAPTVEQAMLNPAP